MTAERAERVASLVQLACLLEVSAPKPGNVSPGRSFRDMRYEDFLASAAAIGPAFLHAGDRALGQTILAAISATRDFTTANTNLGLVLLLAPLARAAIRYRAPSFRDGVMRVLEETTVDDARQAYEAIRLAAPGGLGRASQQDVQAPPSVTLREAMTLAAERDAVAAEWASGFTTTFEVGAPALTRALASGSNWDESVAETFLTLLAHQPDTLIARKLGGTAAAAVQTHARDLLARGEDRREGLRRLDAALRDEANRRNPGTTADLTAAAIFVVIIGREFRALRGAQR